LKERGVERPLPGQSTTTPEDRAAKGLQVQKEIVGGDVVDGLYALARDDERHIQHYLSANCLGDHSRAPAAMSSTRELLTFAMLVSLGGCEPRSRDTSPRASASATTGAG
jgi:4-carboxymuconolactone decarboxylase